MLDDHPLVARVRTTRPGLLIASTAARITSTAARITSTSALIPSAATLLIALDALLLVRAVSLNPYPGWQTSTDFGVYVTAGQAILRHADPYNPALYPRYQSYGVTLASEGYAYPPAFAEALLPLHLLPPHVARYAWVLLTAAALVAATVLLLRAFDDRARWPSIGIIIGAMGLAPSVRTDLYHGEANAWVLLLLSLGLYLLFRRRPTLGASVWGVAFVIKPFVGVLTLYLIWKRQWRAALASLVTGGLLLVVSFVPVPGAIWSWLSASAYDASGAYATRPDNYALRGLLRRLFEPNPFARPWVDSQVLLWVCSAVLLVGIGATFVLAIPRTWRCSGPELLSEFGLALGLPMAFGPLTEGNHLLFLLPGLFGVVSVAIARVRTGAGQPRRWLLAAVPWLLLFCLRFSPVPVSPGLPQPADWVPPGGLDVLWTGLLGCLLLSGCLCLAGAFRSERRSLRAG